MAESEPKITMGKKYRDLVRKHSKAKGSKRAVLNVLADYATEEGLTWPGHRVIAADAGVSERTVSRCLDELCNGGEIEVVDGGLGRSNHYTWRIILNAKGDKKPDKKATDCRVLAEEKGDKKATTVQGKGDNLTLPIYKELEPYIEPNTISSPAPTITPSPTNAEKTESEHQQMFGKICDIVGWDHKALSSDSRGKVAQTLGILEKAGYGLRDLNRFGVDVWAKDIRWVKFKQRPTLTQLREEIGKLRQTGFLGEVARAATDSYDSPRKRMKVLA